MLNQTAQFVYEFATPIRWSDMDAFDHVNASVYFTYFEQTRINWWTKLAPVHKLPPDTGPVVINNTCNYLKPIIYPETILIKLYVGSVGGSSFETFYEVYSQENPEILYANGSAKLVWVDRKAGRSIPIPDELRAFLPEK